MTDHYATLAAEFGHGYWDSRDLWDRLTELRAAVDCHDVDADWPVQPLDDDADATYRMTCGTCGRSWDDAIITGITPAPSARCPFEPFHMAEEDGDLFVALESFADAVESDTGSTLEDHARNAEVFIPDREFVTYAQELADDLGLNDVTSHWPQCCIDWERAAKELQQDYTSIDWQGRTWWARAL